MKLKLIKEYPDSPKLGTVRDYYGIDIEESFRIMLRNGDSKYKPITEWPEYWESQDPKNIRKKKLNKILNPQLEIQFID